jgi:hypothetical protein
MSGNSLSNSAVWVVSIHDAATQGYLSVDVKDILGCLGSSIEDYSWVITELDCTGEEAQSLCDAVESRRGRGLVLSADELLAAAQKFKQTIDAKILGIPKRAYSQQELDLISDLWSFPQTQAQLAILAVDSSFFEVFTKDYNQVRLLRKCFKDVREEDSQNYFSTQGDQ